MFYSFLSYIHYEQFEILKYFFRVIFTILRKRDFSLRKLHFLCIAPQDIIHGEGNMAMTAMIALILSDVLSRQLAWFAVYRYSLTHQIHFGVFSEPIKHCCGDFLKRKKSIQLFHFWKGL